MAKKNNAPAKPKLPPEEALYQAVSLCRKAGALTMGFDAVEEACVKSKAWLVMTASDISPKTLQRLNYAGMKMCRRAYIAMICAVRTTTPASLSQ